MALTRSFKQLVQKRAGEDPEFGAALLREGIDTMLTGDVDRRSCSTISRRPSASRSWAKQLARNPNASFACSVRAAIRRRAICSALLVTCNGAPVSSCT
jgi:hypothetical protein